MLETHRNHKHLNLFNNFFLNQTFEKIIGGANKYQTDCEHNWLSFIW